MTKPNLQEGTRIDTTVFAKKTYLDNLRLDFDRLDNDELKTSPTDLSKLNDLVKINIVKDATYIVLVEKVNAICSNDTSDL